LPKLKNCAEAGPTIPTNNAIATASAVSGPVSVNTRKKDFSFDMRLDAYRMVFPITLFFLCFIQKHRFQLGQFSLIRGKIVGIVRQPGRGD
jgi:hypothetical protein